MPPPHHKKLASLGMLACHVRRHTNKDSWSCQVNMCDGHNHIGFSCEHRDISSITDYATLVVPQHTNMSANHVGCNVSRSNQPLPHVTYKRNITNKHLSRAPQSRDTMLQWSATLPPPLGYACSVVRPLLTEFLIPFGSPVSTGPYVLVVWEEYPKCPDSLIKLTFKWL